MIRAVVTCMLALTCFACAARSRVPVPECESARQLAEVGVVSDSLDSGRAPDEPTNTERPVLLNLEELVRASIGEYPRDLREAGIGGTTVVHLLISEEGCVLNQLVKRSSSSPALDTAALTVVRFARFSPATKGREEYPIWIEMPITFTAR